MSSAVLHAEFHLVSAGVARTRYRTSCETLFQVVAATRLHERCKIAVLRVVRPRPTLTNRADFETLKAPPIPLVARNGKGCSTHELDRGGSIHDGLGRRVVLRIRRGRRVHAKVIHRTRAIWTHRFAPGTTRRNGDPSLHLLRAHSRTVRACVAHHEGLCCRNTRVHLAAAEDTHAIRYVAIGLVDANEARVLVRFALHNLLPQHQRRAIRCAVHGSIGSHADEAQARRLRIHGRRCGFKRSLLRGRVGECKIFIADSVQTTLHLRVVFVAHVDARTHALAMPRSFHNCRAAVVKHVHAPFGFLAVAGSVRALIRKHMRHF